MPIEVGWRRDSLTYIDHEVTKLVMEASAEPKPDRRISMCCPAYEVMRKRWHRRQLKCASSCLELAPSAK
jgi:hypothetical protein